MSEDGGTISIGGAKFNVNDTVNGIVNYATTGIVGVNENGGLEAGALTRGVGETLGEVTGRNQAREANNIMKDQIKEEKDRKNLEIKDGQERSRLQDIQSSQAASSYRATAAAQKNNILGTSGASQTMERDFLGLS